jgi:small conductance mechanosensitive channel
MPEEVFWTHTNLPLISILLVATVAWLGLQVLTKFIVDKITVGSPRGRRFHTLSNVFKAFGSAIIFVYVLFEVFKVLCIDLAPVLASASVVGLAVGFGSQALVKDIVSGFFLLAEDQFAEGDDVEIAGKRGIVEKMSIRTVYLRDTDGILHLIPNGSITVVSNFSRQKKELKSKNSKK